MGKLKQWRDIDDYWVDRRKIYLDVGALSWKAAWQFAVSRLLLIARPTTMNSISRTDDTKSSI